MVCSVTLAILLGGCGSLPGAEVDRRRKEAVARADARYIGAEKEYLARPGETEAAWRLARACFQRAEFATNNVERALLAQQGITPCRELLARGVRLAPVHFYLAMNLGQLARTKGLGALRLVDEMEREFKMARALDEHLEHAGPDRCLGLLYLEAPRIGSIGNRSRARQHLQKATELAPDYPENRLNLAEAYLKWAEYHQAKRELKALEASWKQSRTELAGPDWDAHWLDWEARLLRLQQSIEAHSRAEAAGKKF